MTMPLAVGAGLTTSLLILMAAAATPASELPKVKLPKLRRVLDQSLDLVDSTDRTRQMVIFNDVDDKVKDNSRIILVEKATQREIATLRHGQCNHAGYDDYPASADTLTLVCDKSLNPSGKSKNREIALVTLDVKSGQVLRWFALGGKRHAFWFGPLFFGYCDDAVMVRIEKQSTCPEVEPPLDPRAVSDGTAVTLPETLLLLSRSERAHESVRWDLWSVSSNVAEMPRRIVDALPGEATYAILCSGIGEASTQPHRFLYVMHVVTPKTLALPGFRHFAGRSSAIAGLVQVIDTATGRHIEPERPAR